MGITPEQLVERARGESWRGSATFYALAHNRPMPRHAIPWIQDWYEARSTGKYLEVLAFRGSTKTTTFATNMAHQIGLHPDKTALMVRASDPAAAETASIISTMIEHNPMWSAVFPHVVPDKDRGWSQMGYFVKDTRVPYDEWSRQVSIRKDPTLAAMGYGSKALHGYHPGLEIWMDDLLDDDNAYSDRERERVKRIISGTVLPMALANHPMVTLTGIPWTENDIVHAAKATGRYKFRDTWVYADAEHTRPTWPEGMSIEQIEEARKGDLTGGAEFARNFLGDLSVLERRVFSYQPFPNAHIQATWPYVGGVDYAGVADPARRNKDQSHFALAYVAKVPGGGAVVFDGILEQCTQAESEQYVRQAQDMFPDYIESVVEGDGKGEEFFQVLYRQPDLKLLPMKTGGKGKAERLVRQMGPWLRSGRVRISDAETKFLSALRHFLNVYPNVSEHDPGYDAADAVYWALRGMPDVLVMPKSKEELPPFFRIKKESSNPFSGLAEQHL